MRPLQGDAITFALLCVCLYVCLCANVTSWLSPSPCCSKISNETVSFSHYVSATACPLRGVQRLKGYATINNILLQQLRKHDRAELHRQDYKLGPAGVTSKGFNLIYQVVMTQMTHEASMSLHTMLTYAKKHVAQNV